MRIEILFEVETREALKHCNIVRVAIPLRRVEVKFGNFAPTVILVTYICPTHSQSPEGATFDAAIAELL